MRSISTSLLSAPKVRNSNHTDKEETLVVMSYNVNFGLLYSTESSPAAKTVSDAIKKHNPDIVLLQETNDNWENFLEDNIGDTYPYRLFHTSDHWLAGGVGVLSKFAFEETAWVPSTCGWFHGWILTGQTPIGKVQFMNVHLRPPIQAGDSLIPSPVEFYTSKTDRLNDIQDWWKHFSDDAITIVAGDFNESESGMFWGRAIQWLIHEKGMKDAIYDNDPRPTWEWPLPFMTLRANFDHIFYKQSELICLSASVKVEGASDHYPVIAEFYPKQQTD
eukprot:TRINITY_DN11401_c0_g1_i1.p1 TRINITY_DN11401_c0_g1~~TRINITY_DN11401_c0_g1_i1.p1  ORF type:complete len:276 (+),score=43.51 TRINITY_DN11401_c0_g1_i1:53-880(+)